MDINMTESRELLPVPLRWHRMVKKEIKPFWKKEHLIRLDIWRVGFIKEYIKFLIFNFNISNKFNRYWKWAYDNYFTHLTHVYRIINYIKAQRLSWFDHVQRMPDTRTVKKIFNWKPLTKRSQGRPKYRWEDNIKQDICQLKVKKLDSLPPGSTEVERGHWEGQNFQLESSAPGRRRRIHVYLQHSLDRHVRYFRYSGLHTNIQRLLKYFIIPPLV